VIISDYYNYTGCCICTQTLTNRKADGAMTKTRLQLTTEEYEVIGHTEHNTLYGIISDSELFQGNKFLWMNYFKGFTGKIFTDKKSFKALEILIT